MALTLEVEQKLENAGLVRFFEKDKGVWLDVAQSSYDYIKGNFPDKSPIRPDDIQGSLKEVLNVNEDLQKFLSGKKLTQKYWFGHFADLIIDRVWGEITTSDGGSDGSNGQGKQP
ncbi:hypothetical protein [Thalassobaculum litoreum]|uniref:hypothetical protein n=1 Tax=Thalassobaculum litoreum TaxID=420996 RepID=UPI0011138885|nr:hypothetical protein [Thalassobaculum litoreum]